MRSLSLLTGKLSKFALTLSFLIPAAIPCNADSASVDSLMKFAGNIHQFNSIFPQEKVYLQFDNTSYYTGETIWFKAFVASATTLGRAQSKVLYVELVSPHGVVLKQQKLKLIGGQTDGSFTLIDGSTAQAREKRGAINFPSGFYEIRAYTKFMQNFGDDIIFSRVFAVYDLPKHEGAYYEESPTITLMKPETAEIRPKTEKLSNVNCSFYPEGGHLIIGKPCRVAFKVTDDTGFGIEATGTLKNSDISFSTVHDGMGWFTFTPQERRNQVEITAGKKSHTFTLPQAELTGCALTVEQCIQDSIKLRIDNTPNLSGITLGMTMTFRGELVDFGTYDTGTEPIEKIISMAGIPEGICRITVFDRDGNIYASRSVYHHNRQFKAPVLEVKPDKELYMPFDKVSLHFGLKDGQGNPMRDRFCLSVRDVRGQGNALTDDLRTAMLLSSDLKGFIENPTWYFDTDAPEREQALDLLMLVQGWERYDWLTMSGHKDFQERYRLERMLTLNGWILNSSGKKTAEGVNVLAALMPQDKSQSETYSYVTDKSGYFGFDIGVEFYNKARFSIDARPSKKSLLGPDARIRLDRSITPTIRPYQPQELVFKSNQALAKSGGDKKSTTADDGLPTVINASTGLLLPDVDIEEERMYIDYFTFTAYDVGKDIEIDLDMGEYTTDLMGYLLDKGYSLMTNEDGEISDINGYPPFFYIHDTKEYKDSNKARFNPRYSIESKDIKSIIVFDSPMYLGNILTQCPLYTQYRDSRESPLMGDTLYTRFRLIDVLVKEGRALSTKDEIYNINRRFTTVDGYSPQYQFYAPEYPNGPVLGDVDFRRTLYWNPDVITDSLGQANVEFYNSSITSHFNISAAGMPSSGIPYTLEENF